jgi:hypothetical protein
MYAHPWRRACDEKEGDRNQKDDGEKKKEVRIAPLTARRIQGGSRGQSCNQKAKQGDEHDQLDDATDEEQHSGLGGGEFVFGSRSLRGGVGRRGQRRALAHL